MAKYGAVNAHGTRQGTYRDARMAHAIHVHHVDTVNDWIELVRDGDVEQSEAEEFITALLPEGWAWVGGGMYRSAYLSPKGTVYKVNRRVSDGDSGYHRGLNYCEMTKVLNVRDRLPEGFAIPEMTLYHVPGNSAMGTPSDYVLGVAMVDTSAPFNDCDGYDCNDNDCAYVEGNLRVGVACSEVALAPLYGIMFDVHSGNAFPDALGTTWIVDVAM